MAMQSQKAPPENAATPPEAQEVQKEAPNSLKRDSSYRSADSDPSPEAQDVDMGDGDDDNGEDDGSDNESVTSDSQRPSKKKKGQRFFCTDFPPCQLSFTRSEHLARHIRYAQRSCRNFYEMLTSPGNILASDLSNVIAHAGSRDWIIYDSTHRRYT